VTTVTVPVPLVSPPDVAYSGKVAVPSITPPPIQYSIQIPDAIATATEAGYTVTKGTTPPPPPPGSTTLLAYIKTLGANKAGVLSGQTLDLYSATPLDALDTTPGVSFPTVTVGKPGPATGLCPAVIDLFIDENFPNGCVMPNNTAPNNTLGLANGAIAAGCIVRINACPPNPAGGSNNPWPAVLTAGSSVQNAFFATLAGHAAILKQIKGPVIYDFLGEMNLSNPLAAGSWAGVGTCTSAQFATLWVLAWNYLMVTQGLSSKLLWSYETNDGVGNYTFGYPGNQYVDLVGVHTWAPFTASADPYNAMVATGLPVCFGSCGLTYQSTSNFSGNNYTQVYEVIASKYPLVYAAVLWCMGGDALSQQNGAVQALSTKPWLNRSNMPAGGFSGNK
jgi:Glycosyl hydrolase family 26